jgi:hypothetical protein
MKQFANIKSQNYTPVPYALIVLGKGVQLHAMEVHGGRGGIAPTHI